MKNTRNRTRTLLELQNSRFDCDIPVVVVVVVVGIVGVVVVAEVAIRLLDIFRSEFH